MATKVQKDAENDHTSLQTLICGGSESSGSQMSAEKKNWHKNELPGEVRKQTSWDVS